MLSLDHLDKNCTPQVLSLNFSPSVQQRFAQMGIGIGEQIAVVRSSVANSPLMVRVNGAYFMIRRQDAQQIQVSIAP